MSNRFHALALRFLPKCDSEAQRPSLQDIFRYRKLSGLSLLTFALAFIGLMMFAGDFRYVLVLLALPVVVIRMGYMALLHELAREVGITLVDAPAVTHKKRWWKLRLPLLSSIYLFTAWPIVASVGAASTQGLMGIFWIPLVIAAVFLDFLFELKLLRRLALALEILQGKAKQKSRVQQKKNKK